MSSIRVFLVEWDYVKMKGGDDLQYQRVKALLLHHRMCLKTWGMILQSFSMSFLIFKTSLSCVYFSRLWHTVLYPHSANAADDKFISQKTSERGSGRCFCFIFECFTCLHGRYKCGRREHRKKEFVKCEQQFQQKMQSIVETCCVKRVCGDVNKHKAANVARLGSRILISGCRESLDAFQEKKSLWEVYEKKSKC